jgi:hypothetical protein
MFVSAQGQQPLPCHPSLSLTLLQLHNSENQPNHTPAAPQCCIGAASAQCHVLLRRRQAALRRSGGSTAFCFTLSGPSQLFLTACRCA